jgi:hypothetical protein
MIGYGVQASAADADHEFRVGDSGSNSTPLLHGEMDHVNLVIGYGDENNDYPTLEIHGKPAGDALQKFAMQHSSASANIFKFSQDTEVEQTIQELGGTTDVYLWGVTDSDDKKIFDVVGDWQVRIGYDAEDGDTPTFWHYGRPLGAAKQAIKQQHESGQIYALYQDTNVTETRWIIAGGGKWGVRDTGGNREMDINDNGYLYVNNRVGIGTDPDYPLDIEADGGERLRVQTDGTLRINDEYDMPTADGNENEIMKTDGNDTVSWTSITALLATISGYDDTENQVLVHESGTFGWKTLTTDDVITDLQADDTNYDLEEKHRSAMLIDAGAESGWTVWEDGTACA